MATLLGYLDSSTFSDIATAIRSKNGSSSTYKPSEMAPAINALAVGGIDTNDATATTTDILKGKTGYVQGIKVTGTLETIDYYSGIDSPDDSFGNVNDIYIKIEQ